MSVTKLTKENFSEETSVDMPVIVDFFADWCGPCKMMSPIIDEIAEERTDIKVCKFNTDDSPELCAAFGIEAIPTILAIKNGEVTGVKVGVVPKSEILAMVDGE